MGIEALPIQMEDKYPHNVTSIGMCRVKDHIFKPKSFLRRTFIGEFSHKIDAFYQKIGFTTGDSLSPIKNTFRAEVMR
jgi:hypothetical protein